jgi:hypothetical protein
MALEQDMLNGLGSVVNGVQLMEDGIAGSVIDGEPITFGTAGVVTSFVGDIDIVADVLFSVPSGSTPDTIAIFQSSVMVGYYTIPIGERQTYSQNGTYTLTQYRIVLQLG